MNSEHKSSVPIESENDDEIDDWQGNLSKWVARKTPSSHSATKQQSLATNTISSLISESTNSFFNESSSLNLGKRSQRGSDKDKDEKSAAKKQKYN